MSQEQRWEPAFHLMLEEARRSIDRQSERVQHARERAVSLVGFGSLVAAALGLVDADRLGWTGGVAVVAFVCVAGSALYVLYPREFYFELSARRMNQWLKEPDTRRLGPSYMIYSVATRHDEHHAMNHLKLRRMFRAIEIGVAALSVETVALVARLVL